MFWSASVRVRHDSQRTSRCMAKTYPNARRQRSRAAGATGMHDLCSEIERLSQKPVPPEERFTELLLEARALCGAMLESLHEPPRVH
jgi:hypothetical protein